jgi:hypothetical protein
MNREDREAAKISARQELSEYGELNEQRELTEDEKPLRYEQQTGRRMMRHA